MQALFWDGQHLRLDTAYPIPPADATTAVVRVHLAGICATDLQILHGYMGFQGVPGHEFVGEVSAGPAELVGTRVVGEINFACGRCPVCAQGLGRHCPTRQVMGILHADGCFAEYVRVPVANLHPVPDSVTDAAAVFTDRWQPPLKSWNRCACSRLMTLWCWVTANSEGSVLRCCIVPGRRCVSWETSTQAGTAAPTRYGDGVAERWRPRLADIVVEATGSTAGLALAMESIRPRGTLVLKSTVVSTHALSLAPLVINEITVVGSRCGRFPPALQALAHGYVTVAPLIERIYPLAEGCKRSRMPPRRAHAKLCSACFDIAMRRRATYTAPTGPQTCSMRESSSILLHWCLSHDATSPPSLATPQYTDGRGLRPGDTLCDRVGGLVMIYGLAHVPLLGRLEAIRDVQGLSGYSKRSSVPNSSTSPVWASS